MGDVGSVPPVQRFVIAPNLRRPSGTAIPLLATNYRYRPLHRDVNLHPQVAPTMHRDVRPVHEGHTAVSKVRN